jgi:hypothetical protein
LGVLVLLAACGVVVLPTAGLAGPTAERATHKLIEFTGASRKSSRMFSITSSSIRVGYAFSQCTGQDDTGNFIVDLVGKGVNKIVVNVSGTQGKAKVRAYPRPGRYRITVDSNCRWTVAVFGR